LRLELTLGTRSYEYEISTDTISASTEVMLGQLDSLLPMLKLLGRSVCEASSRITTKSSPS